MSIAAQIEASRHRAIADAWASVLNTESGRLVVWSILEDCHLFAQTHLGNELDGLRAGMREVGLRILNNRVFPHDVRTFADMQVEHANLMDRLQKEAAMEAQEEQNDG